MHKNFHLKLVVGLMLGLFSISAFSQCEIRNRISADGTMYSYIVPVDFYWTQSKSLKGGILTDKENYFLGLRPIPFPEKPLGNKLKGDLELTLTNDKVLRLMHFDSRYIKNDTVFEFLYLIDKDQMEDIMKSDVSGVKMDMKGTEGIRTYQFRLHQSALREQLECLSKKEEKKEDKKEK